ncbi:unnamed protein product, partial [Mesorhabditis spiculigera]
MVGKGFFLLLVSVATVAAELGCEPGWTLGKGTDQCYKRVDGLADYDKAFEICKGLDAGLPNIHSQAENDVIHSMEIPNQLVRLGAKRVSGAKYDFIWMNGSPMDFKKFNDYYMDNSNGNENCLDMSHGDTWNDIPCHMPELVVCQKKATHVSSGK